MEQVPSQAPSGVSPNVPVSLASGSPTGHAVNSVANRSLQTSATGTNYVVPAAEPAKAIVFWNLTGTTIEYRMFSTGVAFPIPNGGGHRIVGITNAAQVDFRRTDTSNTQVTFAYQIEL